MKRTETQNWRAMGLATLALTLTCALWSGAAHARSEILREIEDAFVRLQEQVGPSVVNIETRGSMEDAPGGGGRPEMEDLFRFFGVPEGDDGQMPFRAPAPRSQSTGSGFIYDAEGHIVTNNHVVEKADNITVRMNDGKEFPAKVVGRDPDTDLAVIKIEADRPLQVAVFGDSDELKVGMFAIALGSPRGFEGSLSFGHISALGRENLAGLAAQGLRFQNLIQTDAAINLGNSGGPLVNIDGEVIGINIAIVWGANSLGFAIPVNTAKAIVPELIAKGKVSRGYLGVQIMDASEFAGSLGLPDDKGAFIKEVQPGTPAERAKLQTYDVIRKVNGKEIGNAQELVSTVSSIPPGEPAQLEIWRDEELIEVSVVLITEVEAGSGADEAGLVAGDVITEVGRETVESVEDFNEMLKQRGGPGKSVIVRFIRGNADNMTVLEVPEE
jgi:serine protease Do